MTCKFIDDEAIIMNKSVEKAFMSRLNLILMWVLIVCVCLIATPFEYINIELASKLSSCRFVLWIVLIIAASHFISQGLILVGTFAFRKFESKYRLKRLTFMVSCLDFSERAVLREFVLQRKSVINLPLAEPTVRNLLNSGILTVAEDVIDVHGKTPLMINIEARPLITYKAVGLSRSKMSDEQIEQIMSARPKYAR